MSLVERVYELESARRTAGVTVISWSVSPDIRDELVKDAGWPRSRVRHFRLIGYPASVDDGLPPGSLICNGAPEVAP